MRRTLFVVGASLLLASCGNQDSGTAADSSAPPAQPALPSDQQAFLSAKASAESDLDAAPNDIVKSQVKDQWEKSICSVLKTPNFAKWLGHIKSIGSEGGLIVEIGNGMEVEEFVPKPSPVFDQITALSVGTAVSISGSFKPGDDNCAVDLIGVPWGDSRLKSPDFNVHFTDVEPS
jgi:hypothetical protein